MPAIKLTTEEFINKCKTIHNNEYDYSLTTYNGRKEKVKINCKKHGEFYQFPGNHLSGNGCPICKGVSTHTNESFIKLSKEIHGDKYDYSSINYKNNKSKVKIICPEHGEFKQRAGAHISKNRPHGCPDCDKSQKLKTCEFIKMAKEIHGEQYSYEKTFYKSSREYVTITCQKHGDFNQIAKIHTHNKCGCSKCNESKGERNIRDWLTENNINFVSQKKFKKCKHKRELIFDFYLPDLNTCIEYDGELHFKSVDYFGGDATLKEIQKRDSIKNEYCNKNNIILIRIKYNQNIEDELKHLFIGL